MELIDLKGMGAKRVETLKKAGITSPVNLLMTFPVAYYDNDNPPDFSRFIDGNKYAVLGVFSEKPSTVRLRKGMIITKAKVDCGGKPLSVIWFNQPFLSNALDKDDERILYGKIAVRGRSVEMVSPQILRNRDLKIVPIYRTPKGISQNLIIDCNRTILDSVGISSYFTDDEAVRDGLTPLSRAFREVHFPSSIAGARECCYSIILERLSYFIALYRSGAGKTEERINVFADNRALVRNAALNLPFELTRSQSEAIDVICSKLLLPKRMNLLLEGDVGSGKTIVAFLAAYFVSLSGYQTAIMAPTEILASQHHKKAAEFFSDKGVSVVLLTGSQSAKERTAALSSLKADDRCVVIGTHALISADVEFSRLGLVITDEQHRFGVCQRGALENKGVGVDTIVMTATPIPRTLALSIYGELNTVLLSEKPNGTNNVTTAIVNESRVREMYSYIKGKASEGEKTYLVCPRIDSEDEVSAVSLFQELSRGIMKGERIGLIHGRMSQAEKDKAMSGFLSGEIMILVCTTVIEVGVDVPEATTMAIFGADRYGLSQLHQLRGRIGRDGRKSFCFLISDEGNDRLKLLKTINDGFKLAEEDFNNRGAGDFLGTRQHGSAAELFGLKVDAEMIKKASVLSRKIQDRISNRGFASEMDEVDSNFIRGLSLN